MYWKSSCIGLAFVFEDTSSTMNGNVYSGCDMHPGALDKLRDSAIAYNKKDWWVDSYHIFTYKVFQDSAICCAWMDTCDTTYGYAVESFASAGTVGIQAKLLAYELGHGLGLEDQTYIHSVWDMQHDMTPCKGFSKSHEVKLFKKVIEGACGYAT